jgi:MFS family permease
MGLVTTGALLVGAVFYPLWGYLSDKFARPVLLAVASLIWGLTTWLSAIVRPYGAFLATRASTGIDDSSYPGLYSLLSDYFSPRLRGKIFGFLQLTSPIGYMLGMFLGGFLAVSLGWRNIYFITGGLGVLLAIVIFLVVREVPRGQSEPELSGTEHISFHKLEWKKVGQLLKKPSMIFLILQGFFGVFPWNVITFWFFRYLQTERFYSEGEVTITMAIAVLVLALGYPLGGFLGDALFRRTPRGRVIVSTIGVFMGAVLLWVTMNVPLDSKLLFGIMLSVTALFIPFAAPNVVSTVHDISLPEIRSTAVAVENFLESIGAALTPTIAGLIALRLSLHSAIIWICVSTWMVCVVFFIVTAFLIPKDINELHTELKRRAADDAQKSTPGGQAAPEPVSGD